MLITALRLSRVISTVAIIIAAFVCAGPELIAQLTERPLSDALPHPAIAYYTRPTTDRVAELSRRIEDGAEQVTFDEATGYLRSVLEALRLPVESQMLVMSKTGVQGLYTEPGNPRAIFFDDAVTVGYIRGAPLLELAVHDPQQGGVVYTLDQKRQPRPHFERLRRACTVTRAIALGTPLEDTEDECVSSARRRRIACELALHGIDRHRQPGAVRGSGHPQFSVRSQG